MRDVFASHRIDLELESFKVALDPRLKIKSHHERMKNNTKFGAAIRSLRKMHRLNQGDFALSDKQIRRFEMGSIDRRLKPVKL